MDPNRIMCVRLLLHRFAQECESEAEIGGLHHQKMPGTTIGLLLDRTGNVATEREDCYRKKDVVDVVRVAQVRPPFIRWEEVWGCGQGLQPPQDLAVALFAVSPTPAARD